MKNIQPAKKKLFPKQPNRSLMEGMRVLQYVMNNPDPSRVVDIARTLKIEQTRAHRLLRTLTALGYLDHVEGRRYIGGSAVAILASQAIQSSGFVQHTFPVLKNLFKETKLLVAYGLFWERTVTYLFHARPGSRIEQAISGHAVLPATQSRIGLAILSQMEEREVRGLYEDQDTAPYENLDHLLEKLRSYREAGFAFDRGFASMGGGEDDESSLALTVPGKTNAAVALGGFISEGEVSMRLEQLRRAVDQIARMT